MTKTTTPRKATAGNGGEFHVGQVLYDHSCKPATVKEIDTEDGEALLEMPDGHTEWISFAEIHSISDGMKACYVGKPNAEVLAMATELDN